MRKRIIFLLLSLTILSLTGCVDNKDKVNNSAISNRFVSTDDTYKMGQCTYTVYYDSKTNIVYLSDSEYHRSGITIMYDNEGKPMTLDKYNKTK